MLPSGESNICFFSQETFEYHNPSLSTCTYWVWAGVCMFVSCRVIPTVLLELFCGFLLFVLFVPMRQGLQNKRQCWTFTSEWKTHIYMFSVVAIVKTIYNSLKWNLSRTTLATCITTKTIKLTLKQTDIALTWNLRTSMPNSARIKWNAPFAFAFHWVWISYWVRKVTTRRGYFEVLKLKVPKYANFSLGGGGGGRGYFEVLKLKVPKSANFSFFGGGEAVFFYKIWTQIYCAANLGGGGGGP